MAYASKIAELSWTSSVVVRSKVGNLAGSVGVLAVAVIPRLCQLDPPRQLAVSLLQPALADSKVEASAVGLVVVEVADSEEASAAVREDMAEEEEELDTKVEVVLAEEAERLIAMVTQRHPLMLLQVQAETEAASVQVGMVHL